MNPLMEQLHDIEGIDSIGHWPLGIGWWIVLAGIILLFISIGWYAYRRRKYHRSWKSDALHQLIELEKNLSMKPEREIAITLSEYLRRIAIKQFSRQECAGLVGDAWLEWLTKNDPKRFNWKEQGKLLIEAPYVPENIRFSQEQVKKLIQAAKRWVK